VEACDDKEKNDHGRAYGQSRVFIGPTHCTYTYQHLPYETCAYFCSTQYIAATKTARLRFEVKYTRDICRQIGC
jgi:hypothetical protein